MSQDEIVGDQIPTGRGPTPDDAADWKAIYWPSLTAEDASEEWAALYGWVEKWRIRYPNGVRLPDCWYRHSDVVEAMSALRDFERACFSPRSPATAPVEWQRAARDIEARIESWVRRLTCAIPGRGHDGDAVARAMPSDCESFVQADVLRRAID